MPREMAKKGAYRPDRRSREGEIARIVARQHGVITFPQLAQLGLSRDAVKRRLSAERLFRVQPQVYSLLPKLTTRGRMTAAVLSCHPGAALSHRAAAAIWDLGPWPTGRIDVTVTGSQKSREGVRLHHARVERVTKDGFSVTTVTRTLIDQASHLPLGRLRDQFESAERLGLLDVNSVNEQMHGRRGAKKIRAVLAEWADPEPTRSELEQAFRDLCRETGLPLFSQNVSLHGYEVDAHWPDTDLVVELDGWEHHKTRGAFERDRAKAAALEAAGYRVLRFTWRQVKNERAVIRRALSRRRPRAGS